MELGATIELLGEEVGQLWGRRPPYIVGGTIQPLPPTPAPQRAVLPQEATVLPLITAVLPLGPERYYRDGQGGTTAYERYYGPHCHG